jgi:hypothetical protein
MLLEFWPTARTLPVLSGAEEPHDDDDDDNEDDDEEKKIRGRI